MFTSARSFSASEENAVRSITADKRIAIFFFMIVYLLSLISKILWLMDQSSRMSSFR